MDNSPEYLDMVVKATEMRTLAEKGEIFLDEHSFWTADNVWLPRLDQLTPLFQGRHLAYINIAFMKEKIICNIYPIRRLQEWSSYEKLFLAIAMMVQFGKMWDHAAKLWKEIPKKTDLILPDQIQ